MNECLNLYHKNTDVVHLLPPYSQNGTEPSFCAKYGGLKLYLYSNFLCTKVLLTKFINIVINNNVKSLFKFLAMFDRCTHTYTHLFHMNVTLTLYVSKIDMHLIFMSPKQVFL